MALDHRRRRISHDAIADYLHRRAVRFSQKLKKQSTYEKFVWDKKIQRDVSNLEGNLDLNLYFSVKAEMKRQIQRLSDRLRRMKKKRTLFRFHHNKSEAEEEHNSSISDSDHENEDFQVATPPKSVTTPPCHEEEDDKGLRKARFEYRVQTGYEWNKYNRTHYDHDSPPPNFKDGDSFDTCILRFLGGQPYQDLAFRIVNGGDWDYSSKCSQTTSSSPGWEEFSPEFALPTS
ncbi:hypothetical protein CASFOL_027039 [Castilleja foliolosa]|uniref:Splicing factor Cactin C-terminal domain-containing protein n=1 Tax=Castilleja foliolosa TaxID=1961234 RepID=A0ABD3CJP9_9LAMI